MFFLSAPFIPWQGCASSKTSAIQRGIVSWPQAQVRRKYWQCSRAQSHRTGKLSARLQAELDKAYGGKEGVSNTCKPGLSNTDLRQGRRPGKNVAISLAVMVFSSAEWCSLLQTSTPELPVYVSQPSSRLLTIRKRNGIDRPRAERTGRCTIRSKRLPASGCIAIGVEKPQLRVNVYVIPRRR